MTVFLFPLAIIAVEVLRMVNGRPPDPAGKRHPKGPGFLARRAWGIAAAGFDGLLVVCAFSVCAVLLSGASDILVLRGRPSDYLALAVAIVFAAAHAHTHRKAARPVGAARSST